MSTPPHRPDLRRLRAVLLVAVPLTFLVGACADSMGPEQEVTPRDRIYFVSNRAVPVAEQPSPKGDIYRMNTDGSDVERVTSESAAYRYLRLSPDGRKLAFYADLGACYDIWLLDLEGSTLTQLTGVTEYERCNETPEWSPDGTRIAFVTSRVQERGWEALVMNADGSGVADVGDNPSTDYATYNDGVEGWTPDGRVVVSSTRNGQLRTYVVAPDGSDRELLFGTGEYHHPQWSPDGSMVVATRDVGDDNEVFAMNADGSGVVNLSAHSGWDGMWARSASPWSPDGSWVAFQSRRTGDADVFLVRPDGTGLVDVTPAAGEDQFVGWSPDGARLLFSSDRTGDVELYLVDAVGGTPDNLTNAPGGADGPDAVWVPAR